MKNIHITLTEFRNESRVIKEVSSLQTTGVFDEFLVISLGSADLPTSEKRSENFYVRRIDLYSRNLPKNALFQLIKFFEFMIRCYFVIWRNKCDVVNIHTLALLPFGWLVKRMLGIKLVYDAHELETEKNGLNGTRQKISKWVERKFIKACDLIIVVGDSIADWYVDEYEIERPLVVKNAPFLVAPTKKNLFRDSLGISPEQKILLYQGGLMYGRGIEATIGAFKSRASDDIIVIFMGYGPLEAMIKAAASTTRNIRFHAAVPPEAVLNYTASADIGVSIIENTCLSYYYCMPNKLFEYAMAGLPVITSNMKEMSNTVRKYNFGSVIDDCSASSINTAIDELAIQDLKGMSNSAYEFASLNSWEQQEKIMLEGYSRMLKS